ncbi:hypothetical protein G7078_01410 [Sphingomonas sinipercae]|uniref:Uncharacterized protein n=1 Tax=Sphingomonas sinipercae TaxID=2714944 RepID=A0A6G7ZL00_9SPHN|nr:hypothetical protein [Sphingomonas sinipercae]QIL01576.1 hypothetical protein G7078_01410 [Sphingomonas sinipercae]
MVAGSTTGMGWTARLLLALVLILLGAAAATWGLARYQPAARLLGVTPSTPPAMAPRQQLIAVPQVVATPPAGVEAQVAELRSRLERVENAATEAQGSAGRADALVVIFAARRAIDRGVALGYLEPLLVERFGVRHPQAVATIVTGSRSPVRLGDLVAQYGGLERQLTGSNSQDGGWERLKREFGSLVQVRRSDEPSSRPQARAARAAASLRAGEVDAALAETMRLPGARNAGGWIASARQYVAVHRALDELESAALLGNEQPA